MAWLLDSLREAGAHEQAAALAGRAAAHAPLDNSPRVARLLDSLRQAGAHEQAAALAARAAAHAPLDDPYGVASLLDTLRRAGAQEQAAALLARDPAAHAALDDSGDVASLLDSLRQAGAHEQAAALAGRAAAHAALDDPYGVASLLDTLRRAGAQEQAAALLARDPAAHAALDNPDAVASLLDSLRQAGAHEQAAALIGRLPAVGMFGLFLAQKGLADQFRFGREADGTPAAPWGWEDLDLWLVPRPRTGGTGAVLSGVRNVRIGQPGHRRRNRRDDLNNRPPEPFRSTLRSPASGKGWRRDQLNGTTLLAPEPLPWSAFWPLSEARRILGIWPGLYGSPGLTVPCSLTRCSYGCEKIFTDTASGKHAARPELDKALAYLREGDVLVITRLSRAMRSLKHLLALADELRERGVGLVVLQAADRHHHADRAAGVPHPRRDR